MRCKIHRADVIKPSQPSFCTPGKPAKNLSVTSLPNPSLRKVRPGICKSSVLNGFFSPGCVHSSRNLATSTSWILPRLCSKRVTSNQSPFGSTMRHEAKLSSAVPHNTAFLPPAFMATLPPIHDASAEVGSTAKTKPALSAASETRLVTTPAPE